MSRNITDTNRNHSNYFFCSWILKIMRVFIFGFIWNCNTSFHAAHRITGLCTYHGSVCSCYTVALICRESLLIIPRIWHHFVILDALYRYSLNLSNTTQLHYLTNQNLEMEPVQVLIWSGWLSARFITISPERCEQYF